jgi:hypothetical protein
MWNGGELGWAGAYKIGCMDAFIVDQQYNSRSSYHYSSWYTAPLFPIHTKKKNGQSTCLHHTSPPPSRASPRTPSSPPYTTTPSVGVYVRSACETYTNFVPTTLAVIQTLCPALLTYAFESGNPYTQATYLITDRKPGGQVRPSPPHPHLSLSHPPSTIPQPFQNST